MGEARKLVVSDYLQYIGIALGVLLLVVFVRQLAGVLLTFGLAAILAYLLNPAVKSLERRNVPRTAAVLGVFAALGAILLAGTLLLLIPAARQVQAQTWPRILQRRCGARLCRISLQNSAP